MIRRLLQDLPELLSFFVFPRHLWRKLRTTKVIERCFVEVRRSTRPMVCFVNLESVDRIICSIFQRFNLEWENPHPRANLLKQLDVTQVCSGLTMGRSRCYDRCAGWSSLVARWAHNPKVGGSNPPPATLRKSPLSIAPVTFTFWASLPSIGSFTFSAHSALSYLSSSGSS